MSCDPLVITDYNNISPELCFKLKVWDLQRKFYNFTVRYVQSIQYGEICTDKLEKLTMFRRTLMLLNKYDTRDISTESTCPTACCIRLPRSPPHWERL